MPLKQKLIDEDFDLLEIIENPIWLSEFIRSTDDEDWHTEDYQAAILTDKHTYVSVTAGRAVGKTTAIEDYVTFSAVNNEFPELVFTTPNRNQLDPVYYRIVKQFRYNPLLRHFIDRKSINFANWTVKFVNGFLLTCRIAGAGGGSNVIGLHVRKILVDETQLYPYSTWVELLPCLNYHEDGAQLLVFGVPNGRRERNVLFEADQSDERFKHYRIPQFRNPRYNKETDEANKKQYGGEGGEDYVHLVKGEHGSPAYSVFDRALMLVEDYDMTAPRITGMQIDAIDGAFYNLLEVPEPPTDIVYISLNIDTGYTDPTVLNILYMPRDTQVWKTLTRVTLLKVEYPLQARIIDWLDEIYRFNFITIDMGSSGLSLYQTLCDNNGIFSHKQYGKRITPVDFAGMITLGYDDEGKEMKDRIKRFSVQYLQQMVNKHLISFSSIDDELITELERTTYVRDMTGQPIYSVYTPAGGRQGDDHNLASLCCFAVGWYVGYLQERADSKVKLMKPRWI